MPHLVLANTLAYVWIKLCSCCWPLVCSALPSSGPSTHTHTHHNHTSDKLLVRFYGDHSTAWVAHKQLIQWEEDDVPHKTAALTQWGKRNSK